MARDPADRRSGGGPVLLGRETALAAVARFVGDASRGPASIGFVGSPGVGKTSLVDAAAATGSDAGFRVLAVRPVGAEAHVANAGLRDLVGQLDPSVLDDLAAPQRRALLAAVADEDPADGASHLAVLAAVQSLLDRAAATIPLLVVVDDLHWLDASSADALRFAARRVRGPVGFAWARRPLADAPDGAVDLGDPTAALVVEGLGDPAIRHIVRDRSVQDLDRSVIDRIVELAHGNPFVAIQLAATVHGRAAPDAVTVPRSVDALVEARLAQVPEAVRDVLVVASASPQPTAALLGRVAQDPEGVIAALDLAEGAGIIRIVEGTVVFTHPLLRHGAYSAGATLRRREVHRRLADLVPAPEERARHLALAAIGPDPDVLDALDAAAASAARRGAPGEAAELLELGLALGCDERGGDDDRKVEAAGYRLAAGDVRRAAELLDRVLAGSTDGVGPDLARALGLRSSVWLVEGDLVAASDGFAATVEATTDPATRVWAALSLAFLLTNTSRVGDARSVIDRVVSTADEEVAPPLRAAVLATAVMVRFLSGDPIDWELLDDADVLDDPSYSAQIPATSRPQLVRAILLHLAGRLDEAAASCVDLQAQLRDEGDEAALALVDFWATSIWCSLGRFDEAEARAGEAEDRARVVATPFTAGVARSASATVAAWRGQPDRCRADADAAVDALGPTSPLSVWPMVAAGLLELSNGDLPAALGRLEPLLHVAETMGLHQGTAVWWAPELIEVLAAIGRVDEARSLLDRYDAEHLGRRAVEARAVAIRSAGIIAEADGDLDGAELLLRRALVEHEEDERALGRARTQLRLGALLRRRGRRRDARDLLESSLATFELVGSGCWADQARDEIGRLGLRPRPDDDLTPTERRVAALVADGLTNREVAGSLHASPKTIEAHLTRIYRKVGVRGRAELASRYARRTGG